MLLLLIGRGEHRPSEHEQGPQGPGAGARAAPRPGLEPGKSRAAAWLHASGIEALDALHWQELFALPRAQTDEAFTHAEVRSNRLSAAVFRHAWGLSATRPSRWSCRTVFDRDAGERRRLTDREPVCHRLGKPPDRSRPRSSEPRRRRLTGLRSARICSGSAPLPPAMGAGQSMIAMRLDLDLGSGCTLIARPPRRGRQPPGPP